MPLLGPEHREHKIMDQNAEGAAYEVAPGVTISSTDPEFDEATAREWYEELRALARAGKYEFRGTKREGSGGTTYLYGFELRDCPGFVYGTNRPIEELDLASPPGPTVG